uniref:Ig-like domain-containing protein n=1 Tax=Zonotrichia albicollis TaxID=44394 RepID=A0A8D2M711_ZONAL
CPCQSLTSPQVPQCPLVSPPPTGVLLSWVSLSAQPCAELHGGHRERSSVHFLVPGRAQGTAWPAVLWDWVTLTCQGSGNTRVTTWYKDGQRWRQEARNHLTVSEGGNYMCERSDTGLSPPVRVLDAPLVLQVPAQALLEGDTVTLRCRRWRDNPVNSVSFYHEEKKLQELHDGTELSLSRLQLQHSGRYSCRGWVKSTVSRGWVKSESVTVTVHGEHSTTATLTPPHSLPRDSGSQISLPSPFQSFSRCQGWKFTLSPPMGPP